MAGSFDNSVILQIQQATDIVEIVSEHLNLVKKGKEYVGVCPFHQDHKPSMYVSPVKQIFKCFACGAGGDVFKFIQLRENLTFPQAIERLADRAGIKLEPRRRARSTTENGVSESKFDQKYITRLNEWTVEQFVKNFCDEPKGLDARNYVANRQINAESIKTWQMGFAEDSWDSLLKAAKTKKIPEAALTEAGLSVTRESGGCYDKFRNRLMFPICDVSGRIIAFGGRTLGDDPAKYMNSPATVLFDKSRCLYGLDKARHAIVKTGTVVVVEGYTDVIMCHQFGCQNVVATLGTSLTAEHARMLRRYAKRIILVFDSDVAGTEAANRAIEVCVAQHIDIKIAFVAQGKDPCDYLLDQGAEAFENVLKNAVDVMEFKWQRLVDGLAGSDNIADKKTAIEEYFRVVAAAMNSQSIDPVSKSLMKTKLVDITGLSPREVDGQLRRLMSRSSSYAVKDQKVVSRGPVDDLAIKTQREILEVLLNEPQRCEEMSAHIKPEGFATEVFREIATAVFESCEPGEKIGIVQILMRIESTEGGRQAVKLATDGENKGNYQQRIEDAIEAIEKCKANNKRMQIRQTINDDESLSKLTEILKNENKRNPGMMSTKR